MKSTVGIAAIAFMILNGPALGQNGWEDDGSVVRLTTSTDNVGIGTANPYAKLHVRGNVGIGDTPGWGAPGMYFDYIDGGTGEFRFRGARWGETFRWGHAASGYSWVPQMELYNNVLRLYDNVSIPGNISVQLHPSGDTYFNGGNVGIGTSSPSDRLHIYTPSGSGGLWVETAGDNSPSIRFRSASTDRYTISGTSDNFNIWSYERSGGAGNVFTIDRDGQAWIRTSLGIGTTTPGSYKLAVVGKIRAYEVVVETGWSDFVFDDDYRLKPLQEVETFIQAHKHLPDVPSAEEVAADGLSLGETQALLLQKIEELTLYVIDLKKENQALKARMDRLEK